MKGQRYIIYRSLIIILLLFIYLFIILMGNGFNYINGKGEDYNVNGSYVYLRVRCTVGDVIIRHRLVGALEAVRVTTSH